MKLVSSLDAPFYWGSRYVICETLPEVEILNKRTFKWEDLLSQKAILKDFNNLRPEDGFILLLLSNYLTLVIFISRGNKKKRSSPESETYGIIFGHRKQYLSLNKESTDR